MSKVKPIESSEAIERLKKRGIDRVAQNAGRFEGGDETKFRYFGIPLLQPDKKPKPEHLIEAKRQELRDLEYEPAPKGVTVANIPAAEVWQTPRATWEWRRRERLRQLAKNKGWMDQQMARSQPGRGFAPTPEQLAEPEELAEPQAST